MRMLDETKKKIKAVEKGKKFFRPEEKLLHVILIMEKFVFLLHKFPRAHGGGVRGRRGGIVEIS